MKRQSYGSRFAIIAALFIVAAIVIGGCSKPTTGVSGLAETPKIDIKPTDVTAFVLLQNLPVWDIQDGKIDGKTGWLAGLTLGDRVVLTNEQTKAEYNNNIGDYTKIKLAENKFGWVRSAYLAANGQLAVVIDEKSVLYEEPRAIKVTSRTLPRGNVVMVVAVKDAADFYQVYGYDPAAQVIFSDDYKRFIKTNVVSTSDADVQGALFLVVAKSLPAESKTKKENLLTEALKAYPTSVFAKELMVELAVVNPAAAPMPSVESVGQSLTCKGTDAKIYDKPFASAKVVGTVSAGAEVTAIEATIDNFTVNSAVSKWFRIDTPVAGWVFGADFDL